MKFGLEQLKAKTPLVMRAMGTALGVASTFIAAKDFTVGKYNSALFAAGLALVGKFISECFGVPTVIAGTVEGVPVVITEHLPELATPEITIIHTPTAAESSEA